MTQPVRVRRESALRGWLPALSVLAALTATLPATAVFAGDVAVAGPERAGALATAARANPVQPALAAQGTVQAAFTPGDDIEGLIADAVSHADRQVLVQAYLLSNTAIVNALVAAHGRGIDVRVLADEEQTRAPGKSRVPALARAGIPVWLEVRYRNAHNKIILIDADGPHPVLITGSFNFTRSAQRANAENVLIVRDHSALAQQYAQNWRRHAAEAIPYPIR